MRRETYGEQVIVVRELLPSWRTKLFRIVKSGDRGDQAVLDSLRSHYELGTVPRRHGPRSAVLNMAVSMYREREQASKTARNWWPKIGSHVAELELVAGKGFNFADTGHPGHVSVWGDPLELLACVVDIVPVED